MYAISDASQLKSLKTNCALSPKALSTPEREVSASLAVYFSAESAFEYLPSLEAFNYANEIYNPFHLFCKPKSRRPQPVSFVPTVQGSPEVDLTYWVAERTEEGEVESMDGA
ncbi:hypothetical protein JCM10213_001895 [Rhodosporidiobolus nylandii]